jgi:hypothetical protein
MTHKIKDNTVAVSTSVYWLPIDADTPRNVKVLAINKDKSGVAIQAEIRTNEEWFSHWFPLPRFPKKP